MDRTSLREALNIDPGWSAYALADLDPAFEDFCQWKLSGAGVLLQYTGLEPPVLFASGPADDFKALMGEIPAGRYQFTFLSQHYALLSARLSVEVESHMWRMVLDRQTHKVHIPDTVRQLTPADSNLLQALFANQPESPDAYHPSQLNEPGVFFGIFKDGQPVAVAGTHIVSHKMSVAAIGNIFTHPDWRGQGFCTEVTQAVSAHLVSEGIELIVLNVKASNARAIHCYENVGFVAHCQYLEGIGRIT